VAVSEADARLARSQFQAPRVAVVDNGVDTAYFRPTPTLRNPKDLLFLGSLDWRPNLDAVRLLLDELFPRIRAQEPAARLFLVGRNPPDWLAAAVRASAGVELAANVADVRPYLAACGLMVVPLRIGGGSRLKILEALAAELPVVSTRVGAEGLHLESGKHLLIVNQPDDMVAAVLQEMRHPDRACALARAGGRRVRERYDWDSLADQLEQVWLDCAS
jgi:glycosyltransferase involved in cell wall biosynthesis